MFSKIRSRLSYQLLFNIFAIVLILAALISISVGFYVTRVTETELNQRMKADMNLSGREVEMLFESAATRVAQLGLDTSIKEYLKAVQTRSDIKQHPLYERVFASLSAIAKSDENVFLAWVANVKANFYLDSEGVIPSEDYDVVQRPWYKSAIASYDVAYTEPYVEWETKELVISAIKSQRYTSQDAIPEGSKTGDIFGFTVIDFRISNLSKYLSQIEVGQRGRTMVIDATGRFLYHQDPEKVMAINLKEVYPQLYACANGLKVETQPADETLSEDGFSRASRKLKIENEDYHVFIKTIEPMDWKIIALVSHNELYQPQRAFLYFLVAITSVLLVLLGWIINRVILAKLKPVEALKEYANAIASGNFNTESPYEYAKRQDEMGDIARSFVTIAEVFRQKNALLEEVVTSQYQEIQQQYHYILEKEKIASIGTLVAGIAHEINTPLGVGVTTASYIHQLITDIDALYKDKHLSAVRLEQELENLKDAASILDKNLSKAADLVTQFKAVATNQNINELAPLQLYQELENVIASLKPTYKYRNVKIVNQVAPDLVLTSFAGAFNQVFTNLIVNSMNHGFDEHQGGEIEIAAWAEGELVRITYKDTGKGIDKETLKRIFDPFFTTKRSSGNSGLGMYITHNLITQTLSGTLHVESEVGRGVQFLISVPMHLVVETEINKA